MIDRLDDPALDLLFREARSQNAWLDRPVPEVVLRELYDLMKWGPTSANGFPIRIVFAQSTESKARLAGVAMESNRKKIQQAPVTAILAYDPRFWTHMHQLFPQSPGMPKMFEGDSQLAETTAFRNGTLQGAYFLIAARSLGLDCGPMSGFDNAAVDRLFLNGTSYRSNFICSIGFGDPAGLFPRLPRPEFDDVCTVV